MVEKIFDRMFKVGLGLFATGVVGHNFVFVVDGGERALIMDAVRGLKPHVYGEGMHFKIPFRLPPNHISTAYIPRSQSKVKNPKKCDFWPF